MNQEGICLICQSPIPSQKRYHTQLKYCSQKCRNEAARLYRERLNGGPLICRLPTATTGALHELLVSILLLRNGFSVFRALSPASPCDLIALYQEQLFKIEVTTGARNGNGSISIPKKKVLHYDFDFLAVVLHDGTITWYNNNYQPTTIDMIVKKQLSLPEFSTCSTLDESPSL